MPDPGPAGLYELRNCKVRQVLRGFLISPTVSPSGCKVIFGYIADEFAACYGTPGSPTIAVVDLCSDRTAAAALGHVMWNVGNGQSHDRADREER
jgi:hypothetical protein